MSRRSETGFFVYYSAGSGADFLLGNRGEAEIIIGSRRRRGVRLARTKLLSSIAKGNRKRRFIRLAREREREADSDAARSRANSRRRREIPRDVAHVGRGKAVTKKRKEKERRKKKMKKEEKYSTTNVQRRTRKGEEDRLEAFAPLLASRLHRGKTAREKR